MTVPVFEEYEPAPNCPCAGCARQRRERTAGAAGREGSAAAQRALALATAAGLAWGCTAATASAAPPGAGDRTVAHIRPAAPGPDVPGRYAGYGGSAGFAAADSGAVSATDQDPGTPQGGAGPLHGRPAGGSTAAQLPKTTRDAIISRAKRWVDAKVPYSMTAYWSDGYRQDCSGYVSMAWNLPENEWTGSLADFGVKIARADLQPGDMLLFHNPADPNKGSHVTLFGGWADAAHDSYLAYEQTPPHTRARTTPMAYWTNSDKYVPYRYKGLEDSKAGAAASVPAAYPGAAKFGPGANNAYVTRLGRMLVARGAQRFYADGPGPRWGEADRRATRAFQQAQGWRGSEADGMPGPATWRYLVMNLGKDIPGRGRPAAPAASPGAPAASAAAAAAHDAPAAGHPTGEGHAPAAGHAAPASAVKAPAYPGVRFFGPGRTNAYVEQLGRQLVKKGFGRYYTDGPSRTWGEADRRNVAAFQQALGWRGGAADGYPGPETWRRLFA
ncbi:peptidoglycan-binding protein [Streptomyces fuscigenes]|uniref:peptidoglycan-binding protein n=1 Tax=Streptomyces fuscigenes TaxID=1528880 RepID=UPI001F37330D|nr:peptidoglycan-binding protein [Streptomyces fuscigenes]MCF3961447.1 peptidoglycan-binding protein [Streptomyces fuscigenes]